MTVRFVIFVSAVVISPSVVVILEDKTFSRIIAALLALANVLVAEVETASLTVSVGPSPVNLEVNSVSILPIDVSAVVMALAF